MTRSTNGASPVQTIPLQRALLVALGAAVLAGLLPAGIVLHRRLAEALDGRARADLVLAPRVLVDRAQSSAGAMMMHAKELAHVAELGPALLSGDRATAQRVLDAARPSLGGEPVLFGPSGEPWAGPAAARSLMTLTRAGEMPVAMIADRGAIHDVALAPVEVDGRWVGAAGLFVTVDAAQAGVLAGLTRSGVVIVAQDGAVVASTLDSSTTRAIAAAAGIDLPRIATGRRAAADTIVRVHRIQGSHGPREAMVARALLPNAGLVAFARMRDEELAVLPALRRDAALSALAALVVALIAGAALAQRLARPVRELAFAAEAVGRDNLDAPLPSSALREVAQVTSAFGSMRSSLADRLAELRDSNAALAERTARLSALQVDLMQRERLAATGRLVTHLAHEIRNPVASLRNCMELVRRRVSHDKDTQEFVDLAIDELLRMHELTEQVLDLNRPRSQGLARCRPVTVAREVVALAAIGELAEVAPVRLTVHDVASVADASFAADSLKQVLLNLVQNAREAMAAAGASGTIAITVGADAGAIAIDVADDGPGIPRELLPRLFEPFVTTKVDSRGVGLGLFIAEGLVRGVGGRMNARNREGRSGANFRVELPRAAPASAHESHRPIADARPMPSAETRPA